MLGIGCLDRHLLLHVTSKKLRQPRRLLPSRASGFVLRRVLLVPTRPGEGLLSELIAGSRLRRQELVSLPHSGHLGHLSDRFLELGKRAEAQPGLQIRLKLSVSSDDQRAGAFGVSDSRIAHPDFGHRPQIGDKIKIDIKTRIYRA
jgi:hypothetical protein